MCCYITSQSDESNNDKICSLVQTLCRPLLVDVVTAVCQLLINGYVMLCFVMLQRQQRLSAAMVSWRATRSVIVDGKMSVMNSAVILRHHHHRRQRQQLADHVLVAMAPSAGLSRVLIRTFLYSLHDATCIKCLVGPAKTGSLAISP